MINMIRLLHGYVRIRVDGPAPQRFLNLCSVHDIALWDIVSAGYEYEMNLSVADFFRLKPIVKKTKTKVVLIEKKGLPFRMKKWKKRKVFIFCSILCMAGLYAVSLFLWDIRLLNEGRLTNEMLLSFLQDNGVFYGCYKKNIDIDAVEKKLRDEYPFIIWTSLRLEGTRLFVDVKENEQTVLVSKVDEGPCNLYATVDGRVASIITRSGIPKVAIGDEVKKGDMLVAGEVPIYNDDETLREYMYVSADADIRLETSLSYKKELSLDYDKKVYTGEEKTAYYFRMHKNSFSTARIPRYEMYDIVTDLKQARLMSDFYLPLYYGKIIYKEYRQEKFAYTESEGRALLSYEFEKFCKTLQQKGVQIVEKNVKIEKNGRALRAEGFILVEMSDGEPQAITEIKQTGDIQIE